MKGYLWLHNYENNYLPFSELGPTFRKKPLEAEVYAAEGKNVTIVCNPEAAPRPKFVWRQNGLVIGRGMYGSFVLYIFKGYIIIFRGDSTCAQLMCSYVILAPKIFFLVCN